MAGAPVQQEGPGKLQKNAKRGKLMDFFHV